MKDALELKGEAIWDLWRKGEITHEEVQAQLDLIFPSKSGFFVKLRDELRGQVNNKLTWQTKLSVVNYEEYATLRDKIRDKIIMRTNWANFFVYNSNILTTPTQNEKKHLEIMDNHTLAEFHILIMRACEQIINADLEHSKEAQILHEYYLLLKNEINSRSKMPQLPQKDAFLEHVKHKKQYKEDLEKLERFRESGVCPKCESKDNVISYGDKWKCKSCNKYFRKH